MRMVLCYVIGLVDNNRHPIPSFSPGRKASCTLIMSPIVISFSSSRNFGWPFLAREPSEAFAIVVPR